MCYLAIGPPGPTGATGATGLQGSPGVDGDVGFTGQTGFTGIRGRSGSFGPRGVRGRTGATGLHCFSFNSIYAVVQKNKPLCFLSYLIIDCVCVSLKLTFRADFSLDLKY